MFGSSRSSALLSSRCQLPDQSLWFGRAHLYDDRVQIVGWTLRGRYRRVVPLECIQQVKWWGVRDDVNFVMHLDDGETVPLRFLEGGGTWNVKLHHLLDQSLVAHHAMPSVDGGEQEE